MAGKRHTKNSNSKSKSNSKLKSRRGKKYSCAGGGDGYDPGHVPVATIIGGAFAISTGFIVAILFTLIALGIIGLGIYILVRKPLYDGDTTGTVSSASCVNDNCTIVVTYTPQGAPSAITSNQITIQGNYKTGDTVNISYATSSPNTFAINLIKPKVFGGSFIGIGAFLLILIWGIYYFTHRNTSSSSSQSSQSSVSSSPANYESKKDIENENINGNMNNEQIDIKPMSQGPSLPPPLPQPGIPKNYEENPYEQ